MFFVNETDLPFTTLREGLMLYPHWKLMLPKGVENFLIKTYVQNDKVFSKFWQILNENPDNFLANTYADIFEKFKKEPGLFTMITKIQLLHSLSKDHDIIRHITIIPDHVVRIPSTIYFSKNSPFVPMFNKGIQALLDVGIQDRIIQKYMEFL